ncbi:GntR family transcriptional regulator [Microbacterium sp.]|uniref:GntR family transcriptional regulator n=1 Tax=Microbacterium sp. TaxID=51671 RepID=UPI0039E3CBC4
MEKTPHPAEPRAGVASSPFAEAVRTTSMHVVRPDAELRSVAALRSGVAREARRLSDIAYRRLAEAIISGELPEGVALDVSRLCAVLDVSRTPVREALFRLERQGIVETSASRFTRVVPLSAAQIDESLRLLRHLCARAAGLAALSMGAPVTKGISADLDAWEEALLGGDTQSAHSGLFRCIDTLTQCADGSVYGTVMSEMRVVLERDVRAAEVRVDSPEKVAILFDALRAAFEARDEDAAARSFEEILALVLHPSRH